MKITTFNDRPVRHVRYMPDGTVILKLYERRPGSRAPSPGVADPVAGRSRRLSPGEPRHAASPGPSVRPPSLRVTKTSLFSRAQAGGNKRLSRTDHSLIPGLVTVSLFLGGLLAAGRCISTVMKRMVPP